MRFRLPLVDHASRRGGSRSRAGFSLLEILAAVVLLTMILVSTTSIIDSSSRVWRQANAKIESFQAARGVFDTLTSKIGKATLNTYWDYYDAAGNPFRLAPNPSTFEPRRYGRYSDLHFLCGQSSALIPALSPDLSMTATQAVFFVAPTGMSAIDSNSDGVPDYNGLSGLLAASGFFVAFGSDDASKPSLLPTPSRYRWRLMEVSAPVEELQVFASPTGNTWMQEPVQAGRLRSVAENVIALVLWPRRTELDDPDGEQLSDNFAYDSRTAEPWSGSPLHQPVQAHQLPPNLQVTMVVIDEASAKRLENGSSPPAAITSALNGLFTGKVSDYEGDLSKLEERLNASQIEYRVFSTTVVLRESKWSP